MFLLFDVGGTKTRIALSKDGDTFGEPEILSTPQNFEEGMSLVDQTAKKLSAGGKIKAVVGGIAGIFDKKGEVLLKVHNLPEWNEKPLKKKLIEKFSCEVYLENDAALVGLGEAVKGAGKGHKIVAYLTISTGIGGAKIENGKIDKKVSGFEPGHQIIDIDKSWFPEKERKSEDYLDFGDMISGAALERRLGIKAHKIDDKKLWSEVARVLSVGLGNTILHWSPNVVVLGGGLVHKIPIEEVKIHLEKVLKTYPLHPGVKKAELGDLGGLHGALAYLAQV